LAPIGDAPFGELLSHHEDHEGHEGLDIYFLNFVLFVSFVVKDLFPRLLRQTNLGDHLVHKNSG
jgi:hypothetical protein